MKTKHCLFFIIALLATQHLSAQTLTIDDCQLRARENYPLIRQYGLIEQSQEYTLSNISKGYLPQISLNIQASYQSDVVNLPITIPGIKTPTMDKDQYKATIDVAQTIWDGGAIRSQHKITEAGKVVERQTTEVQLYAIREKVNQLYFGILTIGGQLKQLSLLNDDLHRGLKTVQALFQNGAAMQSDVDVVQVELLSVAQRETELKSMQNAYCQMLSAMINVEIKDDAQLVKPQDVPVSMAAAINRPETVLYETQRTMFDAQESLITAKNLPRLSLFLQGGYGKPGLNMLSNGFDTFGIAGVRLSWNFGNLYSMKNERRLIETQKEMVNTQQETFLFNIDLQQKQVYNDVLQSKQLLQKDDEIIRLRERVRLASESKYENGVCTINDLLKDINTENQSRQAKVLHEIQYLLALEKYKYIVGE